MRSVNYADFSFMRRALFLAKKGMGSVHPNPLVGAVLVKNRKIIGEGVHEFFGGPHAEANAILSAQSDLNGATLYVTLEPCNHFGKTAPCADLILKNRISKVIFAAKDPNGIVSGKGVRALKMAGVQVLGGVLEKEALSLNQDYNHWVQKKMPYVTVKVAQSLDGKIATNKGQSRWISGPEARGFAHELRAESDAVLVGVRTILQDNPRLDVRLPVHKDKRIRRSNLIKIVLDSHLRTPPTARIFSKKSQGLVILAVTPKAPRKKFNTFKKKAEILVIPEQDGKVNLKTLLRILGKRGMVRLLIEGGGEVIASALKSKLVNEMCFIVAPLIIGGKTAVSSVAGEGVKNLGQAQRFRHVNLSPLGKDWLFRGTF